MARPERHDVDYFPFIVKEGKTLFILESQHASKGTGFFTNVLRFLSRTPDHHYQIRDESDRLFFFSQCHVDEVSGAAMLDIMLKTGKLDRDLWKTAGVIVSEDFLDSIKDAYRKRSNKCITIAEIRKRYFPAEKGGVNEVNGGINPIDGVDNPQSKVKKKKEKNPPTPLTLWPEEFTLTPKLRELASKYIPPDLIDLEWEAFKARSIARGARYANWEQAWTTRYVNYAKFNKAGEGGGGGVTGKSIPQKAEAIACYAKCHGNCAAKWDDYKTRPGEMCHWCRKFDKQRG